MAPFMLYILWETCNSFWYVTIILSTTVISFPNFVIFPAKKLLYFDFLPISLRHYWIFKLFMWRSPQKKNEIRENVQNPKLLVTEKIVQFIIDFHTF